MRFIEYMPIGADHWERDKVYFAHEILDQIEQERRRPGAGGGLRSAGTGDGVSLCGRRRPSRHHRVGVAPFCLSCNRIRLTAEGKLHNCLFALDEVDLKPLLRGDADEAQIAELVRGNVAAKWEGHEINTARFVKPLRTMHSIGG